MHAGQTSTHLDSLFTGGFLGTKSDIADGSLRHDEFRTYNNIVGDYYVAPRFLMRIAMHTAKNYLSDHLKSVKIPLILGIWGTFLADSFSGKMLLNRFVRAMLLL